MKHPRIDEKVSSIGNIAQKFRSALHFHLQDFQWLLCMNRLLETKVYSTPLMEAPNVCTQTLPCRHDRSENCLTPFGVLRIDNKRPSTMHKLIHQHESQGSAFSHLLALCHVTQKSLETKKENSQWVKHYRHKKRVYSVHTSYLRVIQCNCRRMQKNSAKGLL